MNGRGSIRLCVAVDLEGYSRRGIDGQERAQAGLADVLDGAWAAVCAALPKGMIPTVLRQPNGDGEVALTDVAGLTVLLGELASRLAAHNSEARPEDRLRMRAAADVGRVRLARNGFAGSAVVRTCRLLDSAVLRAELTARPGTDLVLALGDKLFTAARGHLPASEFRRVRVSVPGKAFVATAWLHKGRPLPATPGGLAETPEPQRDPQGPWLQIEIADGGQVGTVIQAGRLAGGLDLGAWRTRESP